MATGYVHINGTTYELGYVPSDALRVRDGIAHGQTQEIDVRIDGLSVPLSIDPSKVWAAAVWVVDEA